MPNRARNRNGRNGRGIDPRLPGIVALMGVVVILLVLGWGRIQDANERADAAEARAERLRERVADTQRLLPRFEEAVIRLAREVERLRALVLSLGGDPGPSITETDSTPTGGDGGGTPPKGGQKDDKPPAEQPPPETGDGGNGAEPPAPPPPPPPSPEPDETCIPVVNVCV